METSSYLVGIYSIIELSNLIIWRFAIPGILAIVAIVLAALISAAELSIFSISGNLVNDTNIKPSKRRLILDKLLNRPDLLRTTFKISGILFKAIALIFIISIFIEIYPNCAIISWPVIILTLTIALLYVVFIEIIPKTLVNHQPDMYAIAIAPFIMVLHVILLPVSLPFQGLTGWFSLKINKNSQFRVNEISNTIEYNTEVLNEDEDILKGIVKFANIDVSQILRPRVDVVAVEFSTPLPDLLKIVVESGYSRIPVYSGNFDNINGILFVKDLMPFISEKANFRWQNLIRKPYFVPDSKKVKELLTEFQANKIHMAVIVDEYGGTIGIVTLEDILEEIVGEIADEADEDEKFFTKINDNTYIFDAKILLNDFYKVFHYEPSFFDKIKGDADTLAGLILELKGEIPEKDEELSYKNIVFKIEAVDERRIKQIKVTVNPAEEND